MRRTDLTRLLAVALAGATLAGCGPDIPAARKPDDKHHDAAAPAATADDAQSASDLYSYDPKGKRDPFQNTGRALSGSHVLVDRSLRNRPKQALQKFDIDQLVLELTMTGTSSPSALILDPTGKAHMVHIGDFVGRDWGKVSHIGPEELTITETIADHQTGRVSPEYIPLKMKKTDQEKRDEDQLTPGTGGHE